MTQITKGSDLLPKRAVEALAPKELTAYNAAAAKFAEEFNASFPDGKQVIVPINTIVVGNDDRVNFVVGKVNDLSTQSIGLPFVVVDRIAENLGCRKAEGLFALHHSTIEPIALKLTVKAVVAGEKYTTSKGEVKTYTVPAMVKIADSREEIVLSPDAAEILAEMQKESLKALIMEGSRRGRKPAKASKVTAPAADDDEADV